MSKIKKLVSTPEGEVDKPQVFLAIIAILLAIAVGVISYWLVFDDNPPVEITRIQLYDEREVPVEFVTVAPGEVFTVGLDVCKFTNASAVARLTWIDELLFTEPPQYPSNKPKGCAHGHLEVLVPTTLPQSRYILHITLEYKINPIMVRDVTFQVGPIFVIEKE